MTRYHGNSGRAEIIVFADNGSDDLGTSVWGYTSIDPKAGYRHNADLFAGASIIIMAGSGILIPVSVGGMVIGAAFGIIGIGLNRMAIDPPQQDYKRPVRVNRLSVHLPDKSGSTQEFPGPQPLLDTLNDLFPLTNGLVDALERFQGAQNAKDQSWAVRHAHGARLLLACATTKHLQLANRLEGFRHEKLDAVKLDQSNYDFIKKKAHAHELLPNEVTSVLLHGGLSKEDLSAFEETVAKHPIDTLPVGNFKDLTTNLSGRLRTVALEMTAVVTS